VNSTTKSVYSSMTSGKGELFKIGCNHIGFKLTWVVNFANELS